MWGKGVKGHLLLVDSGGQGERVTLVATAEVIKVARVCRGAVRGWERERERERERG